MLFLQAGGNGQHSLEYIICTLASFEKCIPNESAPALSQKVTNGFKDEVIIIKIIRLKSVSAVFFFLRLTLGNSI